MGDDKMMDLKERFVGMVEGQINGDISKVKADELGEVMDMAKDAAEIKKLCAEAKYYDKITEAMDKAKPSEQLYYMNQYAPETQMRYYTDNDVRTPIIRNEPTMGSNGQRMGVRHYHEKYPGQYYECYNPECIYGNNYESMRGRERETGRMYYTEPHDMWDSMQPRNMNRSDIYMDGQNGYMNGGRSTTSMQERPRDMREGKAGMSRRTYMEMVETNAEKDKKMEEIKKFASDLTEDVMTMIESASPEEKALLKQRFTVLANKMI